MAVERALGEARESGEGLTEVYLEAQRGKLLNALGADVAGVDALERAIEVTHARGARLVKLRAATELATALGRRESDGKAKAVLADAYSWFTEGLDTPYGPVGEEPGRRCVRRASRPSSASG